MFAVVEVARGGKSESVGGRQSRKLRVKTFIPESSGNCCEPNFVAASLPGSCRVSESLMEQHFH